LVDGIDAAGMGRGRKRPSYKIPTVAQFTGQERAKENPPIGLKDGCDGG